VGSAGGTVLVGGHAEVFLHVLAEEIETDENRRSVFAHDDIRLARHALDIEPVAVSVRPQPFPDRYLRLGCLAAYMRHAAVTLGRCQDIGHVSLSIKSQFLRT